VPDFSGEDVRVVVFKRQAVDCIGVTL